MGILSSVKTFFEKVGREIEKLFGPAGLEQKISATISYVAPIVKTIVALADPAIAPIVNTVITAVQTDLATVSAVVQGAAVTTGSTAAQTITGALNSIKTNLGELLADAGVKNSANFSKIEAAANLIIGEVEAMLGAI